MEIRNTKIEDLDKVMEIYEYARNQMKLNGNPNQWKNTNPTKETIIFDIKNNNSYVIEEDKNIIGVFSFIIGEDPTYQTIENGNWKNNNPYGTIHRIASSGQTKGIFDKCLNFCGRKMSNIRIDTHHDNLIMQHILEKTGFEKCGIIYVEDNTPRIAYQKIIKYN